MQASAIPGKIPVPFAASQVGTSLFNAIPATTASTGYASWQNGFTTANETPLASGGIPPRIQDVNGINNILSAWAQWFSAGAPVYYDSAFQATIGGYPQGAMVRVPASYNTPTLLYLSLVDNNTSNPTIGGANWETVQTPNLSAGAVREQQCTASCTFTVPPGITVMYYDGTGGGGGGGSCPGDGYAAGGGGGGAATIIGGQFAVTPGNVLAITIGAGGSSGAQGGTTSIVNNSTSATITSLTGGGGGGNSTGTGATIAGTAGGAGGSNARPGRYASAASLTVGGSGGGTLLGAGGPPCDGFAAGVTPGGFGGGGSGGGPGSSGGTGAPGYIRLYW